MKKKRIILGAAAAAIAAAAVLACLPGLSLAAEGADWNDLKATVQAGGRYVLTGDIEASDDGAVNVAGTAEIDLAGHNLVIDGQRGEDTDLFNVTGTLKITSSADSGTLSGSTGRSVIGIDGGRVELDRVYLHGWKTDHIIYNDGGSLKAEGGKLFGMTTGASDGGGLCFVNGAGGEMASGVISRLEAQYGGGPL